MFFSRFFLVGRCLYRCAINGDYLFIVLKKSVFPRASLLLNRIRQPVTHRFFEVYKNGSLLSCKIYRIAMNIAPDGIAAAAE